MNTLDEYQLKAFNHALNNPITIIDSKAGTGKSHTALVIEKALKGKGWKVDKIAPTGKAALRIKGKTIHSWFQPKVEEDQYGNLIVTEFQKERVDNKTAIIVDEASMIDNEIWDYLFSIINNSDDYKVIIIGDKGQLEPVGDGTPFIDYINQNKDKTFELNKVHRNKDGNDIVIYANQIRESNNTIKEFKNVSVLKFSQTVFQDIINLWKGDKNGTQFLSPTKKRKFGVNNVNKLFQNLNGTKIGKSLVNQISWDKENSGFTENGIQIYKGDRVVITRNGPSFVNGETGIADRVENIKVFNEAYNLYEELPFLIILTDEGKQVEVPYGFARKYVDLGYCLTIHKAQGSQWKNVVFFGTPDQGFMLRNKKLVYTAVTRAEKHLYIIE